MPDSGQEQHGQEQQVAVATPAETRPKVRPDTRPKLQPPYAVILHNDNVNGFGHVISAVQKVFGYAFIKAYRLVLRAHKTGRSCVWSGHRELAELKADQLRSCGPDPTMIAEGAQPLRVTIEPMPGG